MNIHEYQAKKILSENGIAVPLGRAVQSVDDAVAAVRPIIEEAESSVVVVKAQIHSGGRGKGRFVEHPDVSGVQVVTDAMDGGIHAAEEAVRTVAGQMLGSTLVTAQTGPGGKIVSRLYIEQGVDIARELYVAVLLDRATSRNIVMASTEGGTEIEEVAERSPEKVFRMQIDPAFGLRAFQARSLGYRLGLNDDSLRNGVRFFQNLAAAAVARDTNLIEINPLVVTESGEVMALDAKMSFEANALYRHSDIASMRDIAEEELAEIEASDHGLSFIKLDGTIGCMVNGAGLAMATMDIIKYVGGEPANFLDVGGGANKDQVSAAFKIITRDPNVRGIFVNIFGGIMHCDVVAEGIVAAVKEIGLEVPLVVRLEGTNVELGIQILDESDLNLVSAVDMQDGAEKILALTKGAQ